MVVGLPLLLENLMWCSCMFSAADIQWVDNCSHHNSKFGFDIAFMQQLCYNVIGEIIAALKEEIMLQQPYFLKWSHVA